MKHIIFLMSITSFLCVFVTSCANKKDFLNISFEGDSKIYNYRMEVAQTDAEKKQGLMFRDSLPPQGGMIFIYKKPEKIGIWMKNTIIPLDILFITCNYRIEKIIHNRQPQNVVPVFSDGKICYVAEIAGGDVQKMQLNVGGKIIIK